MKRTVLIFTVLSFLTLPAMTIGQTQSDHSQHMMPPQGDHGAMEMMRTKTIMLGEQTVEGVKANGPSQRCRRRDGPDGEKGELPLHGYVQRRQDRDGD